MSLKDVLEEQGLLDEAVLNVAQRRKRALTMRRYKSKIKVGRVRQSKRLAASGRLGKRSRRAAIRVLRQRLAGKTRASNYSSLSPAEKKVIDQRVQQRSALIGKLARKLLPSVRRKDVTALRNRQTKEQIEHFDNFNKMFYELFQQASLDSINEIINNNIVSESALLNLQKKSEKNGIPIETLIQIYRENYKVTDDVRFTSEQIAFNAVNSYINEQRRKNPVAKYLPLFNKSKVERDKKKESKKGYRKHKNK